MISSSSAAILKKSIARTPVVNARRYLASVREDDGGHAGMNDFILSILQANPSTRDAKTYLGTFASQPKSKPPAAQAPHSLPLAPNANPLNLPLDVLAAASTNVQQTTITTAATAASVEAALSILNPIHRRTALVKFQGPFTDRQLESISRGMVYLEKLGLVSVILVENDDWIPGQEASGGERTAAIDDVLRISKFLEEQGAKARPILDPVVRLGPEPTEEGNESRHDEVVHEKRRLLVQEDSAQEHVMDFEEPDVQAHAQLGDLVPIRSALAAGEIPVLAPLALDSFSRMVRIDGNDVVAALVKTMAKAGRRPLSTRLAKVSSTEPMPHVEVQDPTSDVDLTPLRLMIINREGGVPSYARQGLPHLLINLTQEHQHITDTFESSWRASHPTSLANLSLSQTCLNYMPPASSALIVSHRSPRSLIANLITNKPAQSSSLPAYLLTTGPKKVTPHTPTLIRKGLPIRVIPRSRIHELDKPRLTSLLEASFRRTLLQDHFYDRLNNVLDYVIVAGDYAGACIVTAEPLPNGTTLAYLDKFAVHPSHQGDGTVDFLWVALHDESFGLGSATALNPNEGGRMGLGTGKDLVWRSRTDNPANRWYYERSDGHLRIGGSGGYWTMFWCDAEDRLKRVEERLVDQGWEGARHKPGHRGRVVEGLSFVEGGEEGRLDRWMDVVGAIPSSWVPLKK